MKSCIIATVCVPHIYYKADSNIIELCDDNYVKEVI